MVLCIVNILKQLQEQTTTLKKITQGIQETIGEHKIFMLKITPKQIKKLKDFLNGQDVKSDKKSPSDRDWETLCYLF